jgi:hypothetical protein
MTDAHGPGDGEALAPPDGSGITVERGDHGGGRRRADPTSTSTSPAAPAASSTSTSSSTHMSRSERRRRAPGAANRSHARRAPNQPKRIATATTANPTR